MDKENNLTEIHNVIAEKPMDEILVLVARMANMGISLSITLCIKGIVICADTASGKEFFDNASLKIRQDNKSSELAEEVAKHLEDISNSIYLSRMNEVEEMPTYYLHLKNVQHLIDSRAPNHFDEGMFRIKLEEVDGFSFGRSC